MQSSIMDSEQRAEQFIITSLSQKSYIDVLPETTLADVRQLIDDTWDDFQYPEQFNFKIDELVISTKQEKDQLAFDIIEKGSVVELMPRPETKKRNWPEEGADEIDNILRGSPNKRPVIDYISQFKHSKSSPAAEPYHKLVEGPRNVKWNMDDIIRVLDLWHAHKNTPGATKSQFTRMIVDSDEFQYSRFYPKQLNRWLAREEGYRAAIAKNEVEAGEVTGKADEEESED